MKVAILAGRDWTDSNLLEDVLDEINAKDKITHLILPHELRAGELAGDWAFIHKVETEPRVITWEGNKKHKAGSIRNSKMIQDADYCVLYYTECPECNWILEDLEKQNKPFFICRQNSESQ